MRRTNPNTLSLLEKAREKCDPPTWYQVGKRTGIAHTTISRCRRHGTTLSDENAIKLAKLIRLPEYDVIKYMAEDRARSEPEKKFWSDRLPRVLPSLAIGATLLAAQGYAVLSDGAGHLTRFSCEPVIHYAKLARWLRRRARPAPACGC